MKTPLHNATHSKPISLSPPNSQQLHTTNGRKGKSLSSHIKLGPKQQNQIPLPVSLAAQGFSKLGCGLVDDGYGDGSGGLCSECWVVCGSEEVEGSAVGCEGCEACS